MLQKKMVVNKLPPYCQILADYNILVMLEMVMGILGVIMSSMHIRYLNFGVKVCCVAQG
jgi:hypothetical protein